MKYERLPYMSEKATVERVGTSIVPMNIPVFETPISPRENFERVLKRNHPMWVPNGVSDFNYVLGGDLSGLPDLRFDFPERCDWTDLFGCVWEWVPIDGGSMLKPGQKPVVEDITEWEKSIVWPDLSEDRIKACCEAILARPYHHHEKMNFYDFGQGCTERLVAVLGGYTEAMIAMAEEPEACREFMMELTRFHCEMFDKISKYFPTDMILYHDDWGTERDTFFGERMMEELVYEPTKIFFDHVKGSGVILNFHCCGNIKRFMPYIYELGPDFIQIQERANNCVEFKEKYGDKIGIDLYLTPVTAEEGIESARRYVDTLSKDGGFMSTIFGGDEKILWDSMYELNCYSREFYENNN